MLLEHLGPSFVRCSLDHHVSLLFFVSDTPCAAARFVLPRGPPVSTMLALWVAIHSPHAFMPAASNPLRFVSSILSHPDFSRADAVPM
jgi:hypothetical protein